MAPDVQPSALHTLRRGVQYDAVTSADPESAPKVMAEAVAPALAGFLLVWVLVYNL